MPTQKQQDIESGRFEATVKELTELLQRKNKAHSEAQAQYAAAGRKVREAKAELDAVKDQLIQHVTS